MSLQFTTIQVPLAAGLNQKMDERAMQAPSLDIAKDIQFDETGGVQTRYPFDAIGINIFGGGTLSEFRQMVENGNELLCFTREALYSWNAALSVWVLKGTHLACKVGEEPRFVTTGDQLDCDRAELNGTIIYAWIDGTSVWVGAIDKTTGSVLMVPTEITGASRPRLVALSTKIMLFYVMTGGGLGVHAIDPATPATNITAGSVVFAAATHNVYYDVTRLIGTDTAIVAGRRIITTSYAVATVTAAAVITTATVARTCDGPIAIASHPLGTHMQIVRANGTNIQGDLLTSAMVDVYTAQAIGTCTTSSYQIAAAFRSVQTLATYRCYVFWQSDVTITFGKIKTNWVSSTNTLGTQASFVSNADLASRAFDYNGAVYVSLLFCGPSRTGGATGTKTAVQNTYFLYRDDAFLVAKSACSIAGGTFDEVTGNYSGTICHLPGVALTSGSTGFSWCGVERRVVTVGGSSKSYGARAPHDQTFTFDSNEARRCARLGETLYITGGEILQYDGVQLVELGFHVYPWNITVSTVAGAIVDAEYTYKASLRWDNGRGEIDRSSTASDFEYDASGGPQGLHIGTRGLAFTHKINKDAAMEFWRTVGDAPEGAPFYLITSRDPSTSAAVNGYVANSTSAGLTAADNLLDSALTKLEENPENGGVLESLAPKPATIIVATHDRLFLAGIAGDQNRIWYSKQRGLGQVAAFNDLLVASIPSEAGAITAIAFHEDSLVAWTATATYALPGDGFDNLGNGSNFGPPRIISSDCGAVSQESVASTPLGTFFKSSKGWYVLSGWSLTYIGGAVCDYDSEAIIAIHVVESQHQVRCLSASRMLIFDYLAKEWAEWTISDGLHASMWGGSHGYLSTAGVKMQSASYATVDYGMDVEIAWIKPNDLQGECRVNAIHVLGEYLSACMVRLRAARDYKRGEEVAAFVRTLGLSDRVLTDAGEWDAVITWAVVGEAPNGNTFQITFVDGASDVEVRDNQSFNSFTSLWSAAVGTVGVLVSYDITGTSDITIGDIEDAINATSLLCSVTTADRTPTKLVSMLALEGIACTSMFAGGIDATSWTYFDDKAKTPSPGLVGGPLKFRHIPSQARCSAIKVRITAMNADGTDTPPTGGAAIKLTGLGLDVGIKPGLTRRLSAAQKQGG